MKKLDTYWFKERNRLLNIFRKLSFMIALVFFISSCSKRELTTYSTGAGVGIAGYSLSKSFLGQSGSGNLNQVIAITTLSTLLGVFMGSEISENLFEDEEQIIQTALHSNQQKSTWKKVDENNIESELTVEKDRVYRNAKGEICKDFTLTLNREGYITQATGTSCRDSQNNWTTLGSDIVNN